MVPELTESNRKESSMELEASYPVVVTDKLIECRDFYVRWFGFRIVFEAVSRSGAGAEPAARAGYLRSAKIAEELPDVTHEQLGFLHGREMAAALELRPVLDGPSPFRTYRRRLSAANTAIPVGAGDIAPQSRSAWAAS
jgi:catechol 2,3-dioxygenase-like lactoylglutathione lyase family enzyme